MKLLRPFFAALCLFTLSCGLGLKFGNFSFGGLTTITDVGKDSVRLNWSPGSGVASHAVFNVTSGTPVQLASPDSSKISYTLTGLQPSTLYRFLVHALDPNGISDTNTAEREVTTLATTDTSFLPSVNALKLWVLASTGITKGDDDRVSRWEDQSGKGNHLSQTILNAQPIWKDAMVNQKPVLTFIGTSIFLSANTGFGSSAHTIFVVFQPLGLLGDNQFLLSELVSGGVGYGIDGILTKLALFRSGGGQSASDLDPSQTFQIFSIRSAGPSPPPGPLTSQFWKNGQAATDPVTIQNPEPATAMAVGSGGSDQFFAGDIAEILIFQEELSNTQLDEIENYLSERYGIPIIP